MSGIASSSPRPHAEPHPSDKVRKSDRTRAEILDAALEFLWAHPFREMTVAALMAPTTHSRPAFYQYFRDVHELMESLILDIERAILSAAAPWFTGTGDPIRLLHESLAGLVSVGYERGPVLRAVADAAPTDERLDRAWSELLGRFDDAVTARIEGDQAQGLIPAFDARPVAVAFNRLDAYTMIEAFGRRPRSQPEPVLDAMVRVWTSTLYGASAISLDDSGVPRVRRPADPAAS